MSSSSSGSLWSMAALLAVTGAFGCSTTTAADDTGSSSADLTQTVDVDNPSGAYFASVTANGTGCPPGTWNAQISDDGKSFAVAFQSYDATVRRGVAFSIKDCTISIDLKTPDGLSFAVTSFRHVGYGYLATEGMTARQTAKYYFEGNPVPAQELRTDLTGPYDDVFMLADDVAIDGRVWSPCGAQRRLNAQTRLVLENDADRSGNGFLEMGESTGDVAFEISVGLDWQRCGDANDAGTTAPDRDAGAPPSDPGATGDRPDASPSVPPPSTEPPPGSPPPPSAPSGDGSRP